MPDQVRHDVYSANGGPMIYKLLRPLIFTLDAERAHRLTIAALKLRPRSRPPEFPGSLTTSVAGIGFPSPVGLAAGFDKDAEVPGKLLALGFGFVEIGTVTPEPQAGNPRPRLFRLAEDEAVINRMGFNNRGQAEAARRLAGRKRGGIVGVNIGANKDSPDSIADYAQGVRAMAPLADSLTVNISSPNTPGLRALQDKGALTELLAAVVEARGAEGPPIFLKVAPDLEPMDVQDIGDAVLDQKIDALIVSNTTISRPPLRSHHAREMGGLSGAPLKGLALKRLRDFRRATEGQVPLIAAGGIASGADAWGRIKAGASLVQLYSALVFHGPGLVRRITEELRDLALRDGFANISEAVGTDDRSDRSV